MNNYKILVVVFSFILLTACADRELPGDTVGPDITGLFKEIGGDISGEITLDNSPYKVTSDLIIEPNTTLKIDPGVELYFVKDASLIVKGQISITGNYYNYVLLAAYDVNENWQGIKILNSESANTINYTEIRDIKPDTDSLSSIYIDNSTVQITHSIIHLNSAVNGGAIGTANSIVIIKNNIFRDNSVVVYGGAVYSDRSNITVINNTFYKNSSINCCGGLFISDPINTDIQNNIFYKNSSRSCDINFVFVGSDSSALHQQYNYFAFGNMDPMFYSDDDLRLYYLSPCKDAGNPDPAFDDYNSSRNDQGAFGGPLGNW
jgi:hypothetical protein